MNLCYNDIMYPTDYKIKLEFILNFSLCESSDQVGDVLSQPFHLFQKHTCGLPKLKQPPRKLVNVFEVLQNINESVSNK